MLIRYVHRDIHMRISIKDESGPIQRGEDRDTIDPKRIKEVQKMIEEVGNDRKEGFIYIVQNTLVEETKEGRQMVEEGILYSNGVNIIDATESMISGMSLTRSEKIQLILRLLKTAKEDE